MYDAKQQKNPVSRTISAPVRKGVRQMVRDNESRPVPSEVIQRVDRKPFIYVDKINDYFPYQRGCIVFTEYENRTVRSDQFGGCYMAAFKFRRAVEPSDPIVLQTSRLLEFDKKYIAHVYAESNFEDTKYVFGELESRGFITIEAMFLPYDKEVDFGIRKRFMENNLNEVNESLHASFPGSSIGITDNVNTDASLTLVPGGKWTGQSRQQYKYKFHFINQPGESDWIGGNPEVLRNYSETFLPLETYYRKGVLGIIPGTGSTEMRDEYRFAYLDGLKEYEKKNRNM